MTLGLTGTLYSNNFLEFRNLINLLFPHQLPSDDAAFKEKYPNSITGAKRLNNDTKDCFLYRDESSLEEKIAAGRLVRVYIPILSSAQKDEYDKLLAEIGEKANKTATVGDVTNAQNICNISAAIRKAFKDMKPSLPHQSVDQRPTLTAESILSGSIKIQILISMISQMTSHPENARKIQKMAIISHGTDTFLNILEIVLQEYQIEFRYIGDNRSGTTEQLDDFNKIDSVIVLLISSAAGGCGLNVQRAQTLVLVDLAYDPSVDLQAEARNYRMNNADTSVAYRLLCNDTVDIYKQRLQNMKIFLKASVMGERFAQEVPEGLVDSEIIELNNSNLKHITPIMTGNAALWDTDSRWQKYSYDDPANSDQNDYLFAGLLEIPFSMTWRNR
jgi:SNF2 family DNA or RNA helicase